MSRCLNIKMFICADVYMYRYLNSRMTSWFIFYNDLTASIADKDCLRTLTLRTLTIRTLTLRTWTSRTLTLSTLTIRTLTDWQSCPTARDAIASKHVEWTFLYCTVLLMIYFYLIDIDSKMPERHLGNQFRL